MLVDFSKCQAQSEAYRALAPNSTICLAFGRGVGKSTLQRLFWYLQLAQARADGSPIRIVCLMPTLKQAHRTHADLYHAELAPAGKFGFLGAKVNKTTLKAEFPDGSWIQWVSAENANDNRGIRCDYVSVDEADDIDPEIYYGIVLPWLSEPHSRKITVIGGTPRRGRYGLLYQAYKRFPDSDGVIDSASHAFHATAYDAPRLVDPKIVAKAKAITPKATFAREWLCDFDSAEGLVYPMFSPEVHVREPWLPFHTILIGVDHGFNDPNVFLAIGIAGHGKDSIGHVIWENWQTGKSPTELAETAAKIHATYPQAKWYLDSSGPEKIREYEKRTGKRMVHATHTIEDGVDTVASLLSLRPSETGIDQPRIYISPKCPKLIAEMGLYRRRRDPKNKEHILDEIEDRNNHGNDALRYACFHHFGSPSGVKTIISEQQQYFQHY